MLTELLEGLEVFKHYSNMPWNEHAVFQTYIATQWHNADYWPTKNRLATFIEAMSDDHLMSVTRILLRKAQYDLYEEWIGASPPLPSWKDAALHLASDSLAFLRLVDQLNQRGLLEKFEKEFHEEETTE